MPKFNGFQHGKSLEVKKNLLLLLIRKCVWI